MSVVEVNVDVIDESDCLLHDSGDESDEPKQKKTLEDYLKLIPEEFHEELSGKFKQEIEEEKK